MMTIVQGAELQQGIRHNDRSKYSCGNPLVEVAERIARIVFMVSKNSLGSSYTVSKCLNFVRTLSAEGKEQGFDIITRYND